MAGHLVIVLRGGRVDMVAADFQADFVCAVASLEPSPAIQGEPWIRPIDNLVTGTGGNVLITPVHVEFLPEAVQAVVSAEDASKSELLALLKPGGRQ